MKFARPIINLAKMTVAGAIVATIAFGFGVFDETASVPASNADIFAMDFADRTSTEKFVASLEELGHNRPEVYNLNGNTVFFSSAFHEQEPRAVMEKYQREFHEQGLNPELFLEVNDANSDRMMKTALSGGVVPMMISEDNILLGGVVSVGDTRTEEDLVRNFEANKGKAPWKLFDAHRYVEINRDGGRTLVTSSWSDKGFDYEKMIPGSRAAGANTDPDVPACPGCVRLTSFSDEGEGHYRNNVYFGVSDVRSQADFYDQAMRARGWEQTETSRVMGTMSQYVEFDGQDGIMREYIRDGEMMQVMALPDPNGEGAITHTVITD